jgi:hypothetical protein
MGKVKLSTLSEDTIVLVGNNGRVNRVEDLLEDLEYYRDKEVYTTTPHHACFDAESIIGSIIEDEYCNGMYEDWDESIKADITEEDIADLQKVFDRILARNPQANISYKTHELIEFDI